MNYVPHGYGHMYFKLTENEQKMSSIKSNSLFGVLYHGYFEKGRFIRGKIYRRYPDILTNVPGSGPRMIMTEIEEKDVVFKVSNLETYAEVASRD